MPPKGPALAASRKAAPHRPSRPFSNTPDHNTPRPIVQSYGAARREGSALSVLQRLKRVPCRTRLTLQVRRLHWLQISINRTYFMRLDLHTDYGLRTLIYLAGK